MEGLAQRRPRVSVAVVTLEVGGPGWGRSGHRAKKKNSCNIYMCKVFSKFIVLSRTNLTEAPLK